MRRKVSGQTKIPSNWMDFLCDSNNKKEHFEFLASKVVKTTLPNNKTLYIISGESVISTGFGVVTMTECNHKEADTRIVVHIVHALEQGMKTVKVRTADTNVIAILVGAFVDMKNAPTMCGYLGGLIHVWIFGWPSAQARALGI